MTETPTGTRRDGAELAVIPPAIPREDVESAGRVGAIAYPYRIYEAAVTIERPLVADRTDQFVASVDLSRRLTVRADTVPEPVTETLDDVLVIPAELTADEAHDRARKSVFQWALRKYSLNKPPEIELSEPVETYKLFWLAERPGGDVILDSVRGDESPLRD